MAESRGLACFGADNGMLERCRDKSKNNMRLRMQFTFRFKRSFAMQNIQDSVFATVAKVEYIYFYMRISVTTETNIRYVK